MTVDQRRLAAITLTAGTTATTAAIDPTLAWTIAWFAILAGLLWAIRAIIDRLVPGLGLCGCCGAPAGGDHTHCIPIAGRRIR